jgi:hypothetical protein
MPRLGGRGSLLHGRELRGADFTLEKSCASFGVFQGEPIRIRVWFAVHIAGYIAEKVWHERQRSIPRFQRCLGGTRAPLLRHKSFSVV